MQRRFEDIEQQTHSVYDKNANAYDQQRYKGLYERGWLNRFASLIPEGGHILDIGCGSAEPIAAYLISEGFSVTGVDFAEPMLNLARSRFPEHEWVLGDMRRFDLNRVYDGLIAWDSFFHLTKQDQRRVLGRFADHLRIGGALMITVGPEDGEVVGHVNGEEVYHASLAAAEYEEILGNNGLDVREFVFEDESCDFHTIILAIKVRDKGSGKKK